MKYIGIISFIIILSCLGVFFGKLSPKSINYDEINLVSIFNDNEVIKLKNLRGKPYIINIFATWCSNCLEENKTLLEVAENNVVDIYGIVYFDNQNDVKEWLNNNGNPYSIVSMDDNSNVAKMLNVTAVPETFVFGKDGRMVVHIKGSFTMDSWNNEIKPLIN